MINTIEETINEAGFGRKKVVKKYIEVFEKNKLADGEKLIEMATTFDKPTDLLFVTDNRVFYFKMNTEDQSVDKCIDYINIADCSIEDQGLEKRFVIGSRSQEVAISKLLVNGNDGTVIQIAKVPTKIAEQVKHTIDSKINK